MAHDSEIAYYINQIPNDRTRRAVQKVFELIVADMVANKAAFDDHTHGCDGSAAGDYYCSTPGSDTQTDGATPTAETFQTTLTS